jgi:hypothetical protein
MPTTDLHLEYDRDTHRLLEVCGDQVRDLGRLTRHEACLVDHMCGRNRLDGGPPVTCRYRELTALLWPDREHDDARPYLSGLVLELRRKIERDPAHPVVLRNVPGEGYALSVRPFTAVRDESPFVAGMPITEPARFFGRTAEVDRIFEHWRRRPLHSAAVVGPRRSGKTSLLCYLRALPHTAPADLRPGQRPCPLPHSAGAGAGAMGGGERGGADTRRPRWWPLARAGRAGGRPRTPSPW